MNSSFLIKGGKQLNGTVKIQGSKNAALPILAAVVLNKQKIVLKNVPKITDCLIMIQILQGVGVKFTWLNDDLHIDAKKAQLSTMDKDLATSIRSSIFMLGSFLSRFGHANFFYPGGCNIGSRPIDLHIKGLRGLGVEIKESESEIACKVKSKKNGTVYLDFPSVGATENLMLFATVGTGSTVIKNAAKEPEIVDLANFLNACGAKISGAGSSEIEIIGVNSLHGCTYKIMPDRIVAGTLLIAVAMTGGKVLLADANPCHVKPLIDILQQKNCMVIPQNESIYISSNGKLKLTDIATAPYPLFPTDLQSLYLTLATVSKGYTKVTENLFETRFAVVKELDKMGAKITITDKTAIVKGVYKLSGGQIAGTDLRGTAALIIAALTAKGTSIVSGAQFVDRGYYKLDDTLNSLGASIQRI